jgi:PAS domain S-box-containing protein
MGPPVSFDRLLRCLADVTKEHVLILLDPDGHVLWWNRAAEDVFGAPCEAVKGRFFSFLFLEEDRNRDLPALELEVARSNGAAENDRWLQRLDGSVFWASGATTVLRDESGNTLGFGKILRNRTDFKEQLDTFRNTVQELRERDAQRNASLSILSHELRNPLTPLSNASNLLRVLPPDSSDRPACLDIIDRQVALLARLVEDLMDVARIGPGKVEVDLRPMLLQSVLREAIDMVKPRLDERGHRLEFLAPAVPIAIAADGQRLHQVFTNLLGNAIKYTPDGGRIWVKATIEEDEAVARVQDDGLGIAPDMLPRIFDLFTQAEVSRTRAEGGLGIGLSVVRDLVRLHEGSVQVRSDGLGMGSEFTVRLPLRAAGVR